MPQGFRTFTTSLTFTPPERPEAGAARMDLSALISDRPTVCAVRTTTNRFPGAPVLIARERAGRAPLRGVVVNNKVANVATPSARADALAVAAKAASVFGLEADALLPVSTGVIGWRLPVPELTVAAARLPGCETDVDGFARAIMTTDRFPKAAGVEIVGPDGGSVRVVAVAKGAGMIEPHLATMLVFFATDADLPTDTLDRVLGRVVDQTFNRISVDGDQSTSDMVVAFANGASGSSVSEEQLERAMLDIGRQLAVAIVRNGEGTRHLIEVSVSGIAESETALAVARHVVNSPLVKTAVHGDDPNVGRILAAVGDACSRLDGGPAESLLERLSIRIAGRSVYHDGAFVLDAETERRLSQQMRAATIDPGATMEDEAPPPVAIDLDFDSGGENVLPVDGAGPRYQVWGSDLSCDYVRENADYRT